MHVAGTSNNPKNLKCVNLVLSPGECFGGFKEQVMKRVYGNGFEGLHSCGTSINGKAHDFGNVVKLLLMD